MCIWPLIRWASHPLARALLFVLLLLTLLVSSGISSRGKIETVLISTSTKALLLSTCQKAAQSANPVAAENTCPGTASWKPDHPFGKPDAIEAFTNPLSVNEGQRVHIYVSTLAPSYSLQIYRLGWYQGLGGHLLLSVPRVIGIKQPAPSIDRATRMVSCSNWRDPVSPTIPLSWVSGIYLIKLVSSQGFMRYINFIVRDDASHAPILFQSSTLTYQAYNTWGGYSLYLGMNARNRYSSAQRSYVVSFDRPYAGSSGTSIFGNYEYALLLWLERQGYNLSYSADVDADLNPAPLLNHRLLIIAGHAEYWSTTMRQQVTAARDAGVSLAFFGGNDLYWHIRLQKSALGPDREVVCYRTAALDPLAKKDPQEATVRWSDAPLNQPEITLLGQMYGGILVGNAPLVLDTAAQPLLQGTTLHVGQAFPGLVVGEFDHVVHNALTPPSLQILASSPIVCQGNSVCTGKSVANATIYTVPSGAKVFDAGTFQWQWGLDNSAFPPAPHGRSYSNAHFQQFTANLITYLLAR